MIGSCLLPEGVCVDIVPVGEQGYAVRVYHIDDKFAGDLQSRRLFPYVESLDDMKEAIERMADDYVRMGLPAP